jgi:hypothetical protein
LDYIKGSDFSNIVLKYMSKICLKKIVSQRCKFADDSTMWKAGDNLVEVSECIQKDINEIMEWSRKRESTSMQKKQNIAYSLD